MQDTWLVIPLIEEKIQKFEESYFKEHGEKPPIFTTITERDRINDGLILALAENDIEKFKHLSHSYNLSELFEFYLLRQSFTI